MRLSFLGTAVLALAGSAAASPPARVGTPPRIWRARLRAFRFAGARPDMRVAVFVSEIIMTSHNCDGVAEKQPWAVRIVRW